MDPNNTMASVAAQKRKNPSSDTTHIPRRRRQIIEYDSDESVDQSDMGIAQNALHVQRSTASVEGSAAGVEPIDTDFDMEDETPTGRDEDNDHSSDAEASYHYTKALGDADRAVSSILIIITSSPANFRSKLMHVKTRTDRTADLRTIFVKVTNHVKADTGETVQGHACQVCK
jgi:hypothetical protein